jgi:hypothetical protein
MQYPKLPSYNLGFSLKVRVVSHPYKTTGKITLLYILIFSILESRMVDKSFSSE